jgi:O-antigen/teichoic acid export membrane protein
MTAVWTVIGILLLVVWVVTIVDVFRRHYSGWTTVGYLALIVILPFVGTLIYWFVRKPTQAEIERAYRGEAEIRSGAGSRPIDPMGH